MPLIYAHPYDMEATGFQFKNLKDYNKCNRKPGCENKLVALEDSLNRTYSKDVILRGTQYEVKRSHVSRRRLLYRRRGGC